MAEKDPIQEYIEEKERKEEENRNKPPIRITDPNEALALGLGGRANGEYIIHGRRYSLQLPHVPQPNKSEADSPNTDSPDTDKSQAPSGGGSNISTKKAKTSKIDETAAMLSRMHAEQRAREEALAAQLQQAAQSAYDQNMEAMGHAYIERSALQRGLYDSSMADLQRNYDYSAGQVNSNTNRALQEAYVNMMMNKRDMPQMLAAQGINGGMSETALAGIRNNYGGQRGQLEQGRSDNLGQLMNTMAANQGEAQRAYDTAVGNDAQQRMQMELQLRQNLANRNAEIMTNQYQSLAQMDNAYAQQMAALSQMK